MNNKCLYCKKEIPYRNIYCNNKCQRDYEYMNWVERWKSGNETGITGKYGISKHLRRFIFEKYKYKCSICGWSKENPFSHTIPLEIEHIDGNFQNNSEDNLILLCPNCHSLTSTYKGANRGNGRHERKKYT